MTTPTAVMDPEHADELHEAIYGDTAVTVGPWTFVGKQWIRESRWHNWYWLIVRDEDGQHWGLEYGDGLTESQENEWPWDDADGDLKLAPLYPHQVTKTEYRQTPAEAVA
jgi:hypothetical protein